MESYVYFGSGKTPQEAFESLWEALRQSDNYCLRKEDGKWNIRLSVEPPTNEERTQFEQLTGKE